MHLFTLFFILVFNIDLVSKEKPPFTDYCKKIEQEIQGKNMGSWQVMSPITLVDFMQVGVW